MRLAAIAAIIGLIVGLSAIAEAQEKRVALVIGNENYSKLPKLNNAAKDARDLDAKLRGFGWQTILKINANERDMSRALADFGDLIANGAIGLGSGPINGIPTVGFA